MRAVSEIAISSLRHGGTYGGLRIWSDNHSLVREMSDYGHIITPSLAGCLPPASDAAPGAGLWLAGQLCDLVQIYSWSDGSTIRLCQNLRRFPRQKSCARHAGERGRSQIRRRSTARSIASEREEAPSLW